MTLALPDAEERRQFGRRWTRRLIILALLASLGWMALTAYYFRYNLVMDLRLLWAHRGLVAQSYVPAASGLVAAPPTAVPLEAVLRGRVPRPVQQPIDLGDVLVGNAVRQLKKVLPLIVGPGVLLLFGGGIVAWICGRSMRLIYPHEFRRIWPAFLVATTLAFGVGTVFGVAAYYYRAPIRELLGL